MSIIFKENVAISQYRVPNLSPFCEHINEASEDRIALVSREEIIEFFKETKTALYFRTTCQ